MLTILIRGGDAKAVFHAEDKITAMVAGLRNNGLALELVVSQDPKESWKKQIGHNVVRAAKWWMDNV